VCVCVCIYMFHNRFMFYSEGLLAAEWFSSEHNTPVYCIPEFYAGHVQISALRVFLVFLSLCR
jgi:uncharacterized membrane protein